MRVPGASAMTPGSAATSAEAARARRAHDAGGASVASLPGGSGARVLPSSRAVMFLLCHATDGIETECGGPAD